MTAPLSDYPSTAVSLAHPARLRASAAAHGFDPAPAESFRYLELGCGNAANLLPLAAQLPRATFLGVDLDGELVARGRRTAEVCGLSNVELVAADLLAWEPPADPFDFVVVHGVYSWVAADVKDRILALAARCLAPFGVAYLSYNTYPGWALRGVVRHVMLDAASGVSGDVGRLRAARARVAELRRYAVSSSDPYTALLATELALIDDKPDGYLLGEHLAAENEPVYFKALCERVEAHGLAYLCELMPATAEGGLDRTLPADLRRTGMSRVDAEQALDVLCYRQFRASLFCKQGAPASDAPDLAPLVPHGVFAGRLTPSAAEPLLGPGKQLRFRARTGAEIEAHRPLLKAALLSLAEAWPEGLGARRIIEAAMALLRERGLVEAAHIDEAEIEQTVRDLVELCERRLIELLPWSSPIHREIARRPAVSTLTRLEAERTGVVTTPLHEPERLGEPTRTITTLLDGTRDLRALIAELSARLDSGEIAVDGELPPTRRAEILAELVASAIGEIRALGLLVPG